MVLVRELTDYLYGSKEYLSTCIKIPEFPIISWVLVVIIVSFNKILYCHNILKLPDTKHCSRHFFPLHCSLSARKLSRLFHHRNPPPPPFLATTRIIARFISALSWEPEFCVQTAGQPERVQSIGMPPPLYGNTGRYKITQKECLHHKWFEVASGQLLLWTMSESCRN